jgi:hypothetical protein
MKLWIVWTGMLLLQWGCGSDRSMGGFGSETTNGVEVSGMSDPSVRVVARSLNTTVSDREAVADGDGNWRMELAPGGWGISAIRGGRGMSRNLVLDSGDHPFQLGQVSLGALHPLEGQAGAGMAGGRVELPALGRVATVVSDGSFRFDSVPSGIQLVRLRVGGVVRAEALAAAGAICRLDPSSSDLLLDDFDDGDDRTAVADLLGSSWWLVQPGTDSGQNLTPRPVDSVGFRRYLTDSSAWSGKSLHAIVSPASPDESEREAAFMMVLGSRGSPSDPEQVHDLSGSDSVVFMARGSGNARLELWAYPRGGFSSSDLAANRIFLVAPVALSPTWTRVAVAWSDLRIGATTGPAVGADFARYRVLKLTWVASDAEIWLDDIRIPGATPSLLLR